MMTGKRAPAMVAATDLTRAGLGLEDRHRLHRERRRGGFHMAAMFSGNEIKQAPGFSSCASLDALRVISGPTSGSDLGRCW